MMFLIHTLARTLAPWQSLYSNSKAVSGMVTTVHLASLLFSGGLAVAADRSTLRVSLTRLEDQSRQLVELRAVHRPVLIALGVLCLSGVLLAAADIETFVQAPLFLVKLSLVALLCTNGVVLVRRENALRRATAGAANAERIAQHWRRLRVSALCSLALWTATLVVGTLLVDIA